MCARDLAGMDRHPAKDESPAEWYNVAAIRDLIKAAFTAKELRRFCQDRPALRPLVDRFSVDLRLEEMADDIVDYCQKRALFAELLSAIRDYNPVQYEKQVSHLPLFEAAAEGAPEPASLSGRLRAFAQTLRAAQAADPDAGGPYRGLLEYRLSDAALFFGRERAIHELGVHLARSPLTVLHAESGAGKTSLLKAGISPPLLAAGHLPVHLRPHNASPALALKRLFFPGLDPGSEMAAMPLRDWLRRASRAYDPQATLYLLVDQFEEFFLYLDETARTAFVGELAECLEDTSLHVRWVLSLRSEFFGNLATFRPRIRNPFENDYRLGRLTRAEAQEVVTQPAARYGVVFEEGLVAHLLDDLGGGEIAPPQVQLVCQALYEGLPPGTKMVSRAQYDGLGGAAGILREHLERVLKRDLPEEQRAAARCLVEALVTADGRRALRTRAELAAELAPLGVSPDLLDAILSQLWDSRLVHLQEKEADGSKLAYELVHDYLLEQIGLSPEVQARKAARDLLEREVLNWRHYGALMRPQTLQVVGAQREVLYIDEVAGELLARSALETDVDLAGWLAHVSPQLARRVLLDGLDHPLPALRARAARHLARFFDDEAGTRLVEHAGHDPEPEVRDAALETLAQAAPERARQVLLADLEHPDAARRSQAIQSLGRYLDAQTVDRLLALAGEDGDEEVWGAALETLADDRAAPHRDHWRPLLKASLSRQAAAYHKLRRLRVEIPFSFRLRLVPARAAGYLQHEARTRPVWLAARVLLVVALYFGLAWFLGWPPFERWDRVPGSPRESLLALEIVDGRLYVGSFDRGLARRSAVGTWSDWLRQGLPTTKPGQVGDPESDVEPIEAIAADRANPDRVYALVEDHGLFFSPDAGATWTPLGAGQVPIPALGLDVQGETVLVAAVQQGLYGSDDGGQAWRQIHLEAALPDEKFLTVRFDPGGVPYAGSTAGLYRGAGAFPWTWDKVAGDDPVSYLDFGPGQRLYLALGWPDATHAACYTPGGGLGPLIDLGGSLPAGNITALVAHPTEADRFYVGTPGQVYALTCAGKKQKLGQVRGGMGAGTLAFLPGENGEALLVLTGFAGLYQHAP